MLNQIKLHTEGKTQDGRERTGHELTPDSILCNDVMLPGEPHPHGMKLYIIGNEYGALCAVWANCEQDAIDEAIDAGKADGLLIDEPDDENAEVSRAGNASEPISEYTWIAPVIFDITDANDVQTLLKFAEARGANADTLDDI